MKAIQATPKEIRKIFSDSYVIPNFQRPYSWEIEQCETLWDDITDFHSRKLSNDERYFLGTIVVNSVQDDKLAVVDGQQRLTTLLLLAKAFYKSAGTYSSLEKCLRLMDKRTDKLTDELRVTSDVIANDAENLKNVIFDKIQDDNSSDIVVNYRFFVEKIEKWRADNGDSSDALSSLIDTFLDNIVILPIECGSGDDALTIFQTINNRGMSLTDADIFKANLYHKVPEQERSMFIEDWKALGSSENAERLFRVLMHVRRAENKITDKEIGLRAFFSADKSAYLSDWKKVMDSLKVINSIDKPWQVEAKELGASDSLWAILRTYPNLYWNYPIYTYLHKHGSVSQDGVFILDQNHYEPFKELLNETVKYYFIKGVVHNVVNVVKDTTFKVCAAIYSESDYKAEYDSNIVQSDRDRMNEILNGGVIGWRYLRGLVALSAYLNPKQDSAALSRLLWGRYDVEHILPKQWNHYDGWTEAEHATYLNQLGNLVPFERVLNIKAQNEYFRKKKEHYSNSAVQDALDLVQINDNGWTPDEVASQNKMKIERLKNFFTV